MVDEDKIEEAKKLATKILGRKPEELEEEHKESVKRIRKLDRRLRSMSSQTNPGICLW